MNELIIVSDQTAISTSIELQELVNDTIDHLANSEAKNTTRAYGHDWEHFKKWCTKHTVQYLPASEQIVSLYITDLAKTRKASTIQRRLITIRKEHLKAKYEPPTSKELVKQTMKGILRKIGRQQNRKEPLLTDDIVKIVRKLPDTPKGIRDKAILLVGFMGALRRSELVNMRLEALSFERNSIRVLIPKSKTDQIGEGFVFYLEPSHDELTCPVTALKNWIETAKITEGHLFLRVQVGGKITKDVLTTDSIARIVKRYARDCGYNPENYGGHSLRAGFATQLAINGVDDREIMEHTRHKSRDVFERYVRLAKVKRKNITGKLGL